MPYVQGSMKELNRKTVFELITEMGEITRVDIAEVTKSSMPTILKITNFLLEQQIVSLVGLEKTARGRRPQVLRFEPDTLLGIGLSFDGNHVIASLINYYGKEIKCIEKDLYSSFDDMMENGFCEIIEELIKDIEREHIKSIGISVAGSVDTENSKVRFGGFAELKSERETSESVGILSEKIKLPIYLFNDVNAAATGEYVLRKMKNTDLVYIYVGEGTGAGVILDGILRTGHHFYTGEIAHMVFDADFSIDLNRPGWMESQLARKTIEQVSQDQNARIDYAARYISLMIANICNVLDIENVVVGGEIVDEMGDALIDRTNQYLEHLSMFRVTLTRPVSRHSSLIGAASMAMDKELTTILADNE